MSDWNWIVLVLFALAGGLSLGKGTWSAFGAMAACAGGVLAGLTLGWTLEQLSLGVLVLCVLTLWPMVGKGDDL